MAVRWTLTPGLWWFESTYPSLETYSNFKKDNKKFVVKVFLNGSNPLVSSYWRLV